MQRLLVITAAAAVCALAQTPSYRGWTAFGGGSDNIHYSSLKQITPANVSQLKVAWTYDSGDAYPGSDIQCNPIVVDGVMYVTTAKLKVAAVDARTGREIWVFDGLKGRRPAHKNRGLTYWTDGRNSRLLFGLDHYLLSLDAKTGKLDPAFGKDGRVDMREAFPDRNPETTTISLPTPGAIYKDLIILGSSVPETHPSTPGDIRAYNVRTGRLAWTFHTIPHPGEAGYETWPKDTWKYTGGANAWAGLVVDVKRGAVYATTGSAAYDFYGADRAGDNLFANSILCLDAATGKRKWHYQTVRHDVWDLDFPAAPLLATVRHRGKTVDAVVAAGKDGNVWVLNRDTGESLFPVEERPVPASPVEGESLAKMQKFPLAPRPFTRQVFDESTVTNRTPEAHAAVLQRLRELDHSGRFEPPSLRGNVVFPGFAGGAEWGGEAYDPETHLYYVNANELAWITRLVPPSSLQRKSLASRIYRSQCASCHGVEKKGAPPEYPSLDDIGARMNAQQLAAIIRKGTGRMPAFAKIGDPAVDALTGWLLTGKDEEAVVERGPKPPVELKYVMDGYKTFTDPDGYPASTPPWGSLTAINLDTGEHAWKVPLGEYPELVEKGMKDTGSENHGGGIVTAGGLFFIAATHYDNKLRAFDKRTGRLVWETKLPFAGNATPAMFEIQGKAYLVVPCGGGRERPSGSQFVAFTLP
jgi:quinoprotein glucose dehydrogenase